MKRIKVALGSLKPNPFKKEIQCGRLNLEQIAKLEETMRQKGAAWHDGALIGREIKGKIEIAFGHHRLQAMINVFGKTHEITVEVLILPMATCFRNSLTRTPVKAICLGMNRWIRLLLHMIGLKSIPRIAGWCHKVWQLPLSAHLLVQKGAEHQKHNTSTVQTFA